MKTSFQKKNLLARMLAVAVSVAMLGGLTACGASSKEPASGSARQPATPHRQRWR